MSFTKTAAAWLFAVSALSACTAIVSTPDLPVCTENLDCEVANRLFADRTTECLQYRCVNGGCSLALPDLDADSEVSVECGGTDCDDMNPARRMGAVELCDQVDNDCDFVVDEALPSDAAELGSVILESPVGAQTNVLTSAAGEALLLVRAGETRIARLSSSMATYDDISIRSRRLQVVGESTTGSETSDGCVVRQSNPILRVENVELRRGVCGDASDCTEFDAPCVAVRCEDSECVYDRQHSFCEDDDPCNGQELCTPDSASADANGCTMPAAAGCDEDEVCDAMSNTCRGLVDQTCSPVDVAVGAAGDSKVLATIETDRCPSGVLRLGPDVGSAEEHVLLQSAFATGFARGEVDVDSDDCTRDGASSLALAVSSTDAARCGSVQPTALVAYVATPFREERECSDSATDPSQVRVAGAHFVPVLGQPLVVPTDAGAVLVAGETDSSARPVLVTLAEPGRFLLMFADVAGGLRFSVLGLDDCAPDPADIADAATHLSPLSSERLFTGGVTHISAVALPDLPDVPTSGSRFAFVYTVGCATASRSFLTTVEVRGSELEIGTPTDITLEDRRAEHPTLRVSSGPVLLGGHSTVDEDTHALLVAWSDEQGGRTEVHGRRFMLDASTPIDAVPFVVSAAADDNSIDPHVFVDGTGAAFVSYTRPDASGVVLRPFCGPSR